MKPKAGSEDQPFEDRLAQPFLDAGAVDEASRLPDVLGVRLEVPQDDGRGLVAQRLALLAGVDIPRPDSDRPRPGDVAAPHAAAAFPVDLEEEELAGLRVVVKDHVGAGALVPGPPHPAVRLADDAAFDLGEHY